MAEPLNTNMVVLNGVDVIDPTELTWGLSDVSASDAGRDESVTMHKMRIGQKRGQIVRLCRIAATGGL